MALYTQAQADGIINSGFNVNPGTGWIESETWHAGEEDTDLDGNTITVFKGWRYSLIDHNGNPLEFLLESTAEAANEATRRADAVERIKTIEVCEC